MLWWNILPDVQAFMLLGTMESLVPGERQECIRLPACWAGLQENQGLGLPPGRGPGASPFLSLAVSGHERLNLSQAQPRCHPQKCDGESVLSTLSHAHFLEATV